MPSRLAFHILCHNAIRGRQSALLLSTFAMCKTDITRYIGQPIHPRLGLRRSLRTTLFRLLLSLPKRLRIHMQPVQSSRHTQRVIGVQGTPTKRMVGIVQLFPLSFPFLSILECFEEQILSKSCQNGILFAMFFNKIPCQNSPN